MPEYLDHPFSIDPRGGATTVGPDDHVRDMILQLLFTNPGERVNRPEFGCGLKSLAFMPNSPAIAAATQALVKGALQKWLEREIEVESVEAESQDEVLTVSVAYRRRLTGERNVETFTVSREMI
jgi:phage baseplate assembly protein W